MNWFSQRTPLRRLLFLKAAGRAVIALAIGMLPLIVECPPDGRLFAVGIATFFAILAWRDFSRAKKSAPDAFLEDGLDNERATDSMDDFMPRNERRR